MVIRQTVVSLNSKKSCSVHNFLKTNTDSLIFITLTRHLSTCLPRFMTLTNFTNRDNSSPIYRDLSLSNIYGIIFAVNKITKPLNKLAMRTFILLLLTMVFISCNKKEETRPIDIIVDLKDDVSPVVGEISIPGQFDFIEWTFEEIYMPTEDSPNPAKHVFSTKGSAKIKVVAFKNDTREKFIGNSEITIPDVANKLKIAGFCFKDIQGPNPYNQKQISVSLTYQKLGTATAKTISISPAEFSPTDTIYFPEPMIYNIDGFENGGFSDYEIFITINSNQDNNLAFRSSFNLTGKYFWERSWTPGFVQISNFNQNQLGYIFLLCDWMPN